jgi:23S rRNA pseudouridine955/2504/2580 synthase
MNIPILFENSDCMALDKPAGLAVQGGRGVGKSLDDILSAEFSPRPLLVHRLDKDTSGVILVAKNPKSAAFLSKIFAEKNAVMKRYLALCAGTPEPPAGRIETALHIKGVWKKASTSYSLIKKLGKNSLLELELGTGRMHQIRRHLNLIGNPVLGDEKYGDFALNRELRKTMGLKRLLLHSSRLIILPASGLSLDVTSPPPDYWKDWL